MAKVLIVDDSPIVTQIVMKVLGQRGHVVECASSPFGVVNRVRDFQPDLILMDLDLPGLSGRKLIEMIRSQLKSMATKILVFSSHDESSLRAVVAEVNADGYVKKGTSIEPLLSAVDRHLAVGRCA